ncbi:MAG: serine hydrolase domain-containing protein [Minisyncoccota bacterium]
MEEAISECANKAIADLVFPGCVVGLVRKNGQRQILPFGHFTYDPGSPFVEIDSIYDLASITKSIPTGSLALQLIDEGRLSVTDKLIEYVPEFNNSDRENVLIKHLLTYTIDGYGLASILDGNDLASLKNRTVSQLKELLLTRNFEKRPGAELQNPHVFHLRISLKIRCCASQIDSH